MNRPWAVRFAWPWLDKFVHLHIMNQEQKITDLKAENAELRQSLAAREHSHRILVDELLPSEEKQNDAGTID